MKHLLLFIAVSLSISSFAQKSQVIYATKQLKALTDISIIKQTTGLQSYRQTALGDTVYMSHIASTDTITLYYAGTNSGFVNGMDSYGDKGFAERYDFASGDSSVKVIGLISRFGGTVNPNSNKTVVFHIWSPAGKTVSSRSTLFNSGLPGTNLASKTVSLPELGVSTSDTVDDSAKVFMFGTSTAFLTNNFFVGYTINYTWGNGMAGDTIGLYSNKDGERTAPSFTVLSSSTYDTTVNNVNVTQYSDGTWHDNAVDNYAIRSNLYIFPIVSIGPGLTAINGISQGGFRFYGCYPNPAGNETNVRLSLTATTSVAIDIMNMNGTRVNTVQQDNLSTGEHTLTIPTKNLSAGDYVLLIHTGDGNGIASKMTITR